MIEMAVLGLEKQAHVQKKEEQSWQLSPCEFFPFSRRQRFPVSEFGPQQWVRCGGCKVSHPQTQIQTAGQPRKAATDTVNKQDGGRMSLKSVCKEPLNCPPRTEKGGPANRMITFQAPHFDMNKHLESINARTSCWSSRPDEFLWSKILKDSSNCRLSGSNKDKLS